MLDNGKQDDEDDYEYPEDLNEWTEADWIHAQEHEIMYAISE